MANLNISKFVSSTFGVATELVVQSGGTVREVGNTTHNLAKVTTSVSAGILQESEAFFEVRAVDLEADTKASKLKATMRLKAIDSISKDTEKLKAVEEAIFNQMLEDFSDI